MMKCFLRGKRAYVKTDKIIAFWLPADDTLTFQQTYSSISASLERCLRPGSVWVYKKHRTLVDIMVTILRITHCLYSFSSKKHPFSEDILYNALRKQVSNSILCPVYIFQVYIVTKDLLMFPVSWQLRWAGSLPRLQQSGAIK